MNIRVRFALLPAAIMMVAAALACRSGPVARFFPTATPTPTNTPTATPTPTNTPTPTPTDTPTATPTPLPTGVASEKEPDGSTLFTDYDGHYQLSLGSEWAVIPFTPEELLNFVGSMADENPQLAAQAGALQQLDPDILRMVALNKDPALSSHGFATNVNVAAFEDHTMATMPLEFLSGSLEESLENQGARILTQGVNTIDNPNGVEVQFIDLEQTEANPLGGYIIVRSRILIFQAGDRLILVTVVGPTRLGNQVFAAASEIGTTIDLLDQ